MKRLKRIISLLLSLALLAGNLPLSARAEETEFLDPGLTQYFQTDYPDVAFGGGTLADRGGAITALAMAATHVKGQEYRPETLAKQYGGLVGGNGWMEYISLALGLPCKKADTAEAMLTALADGRVAVAQMGKDSVFALKDQEYHYVLLAGITEEGTVIVCDPYEPHYEDPALEKGFREGFSASQILLGCEGGWSYGAGRQASLPAHGTQISGTGQGTIKTGVSSTAVFSQSAVPLYFQNDYPNDRFGMGTVASSGCSVTSLAMVATYLTGHKYTPDELADYCGGHGENNIDRMEYGATLLQLPWKKAENIHDVTNAMHDGDLAIVLMGPSSIFTDSQHFIVLTGLNDEGRIMINDSFKPNYDHWLLKNGFKNGFTENDILLGYSGAWIFDVDAMPEEPFIYIEEKPYVAPRYPGIELTWEEQQLLAKIIWVEARGESKEGQQAVAEVVYNRMISGDFPDTLNDVIFAAGQFDSVKYLDEAEPYQAQYEALEDALSGPYVLPIEVVHFSRAPANENVWGKIGGHVFCYASETDMG